MSVMTQLEARVTLAEIVSGGIDTDLGTDLWILTLTSTCIIVADCKKIICSFILHSVYIQKAPV